MPVRFITVALPLFLLLSTPVEASNVDFPSFVLEANTSGSIDLLETKLTAVLTNNTSTPIDLVIPSGAFPLEVELLDAAGHDLLSSSRKPLTSHRREAGLPVQTLHLAPNAKRSFEMKLGQYLESRGLPRQTKGASAARLYVAASIDQTVTFSVIRSNLVPLHSE